MKIAEMNKREFREKLNGRRYDELNKFEQLEYAKFAVIDCLEDAEVMIDWHDIGFWANEVKRLREEIKKIL